MSERTATQRPGPSADGPGGEAAGDRQADRSAISAGGVVYRRSGDGLEVLLGHQTDWNTGDANIRLPKGHVDPGETLEQAAVREVLEETGRRARVEAPLGENRYRFVVESSGESVDKCVVYFLLADEGPGDAPRDGEMERIEWVAIADAADRLTFENERGIVRRAAEALHSASPP